MEAVFKRSGVVCRVSNVVSVAELGAPVDLGRAAELLSSYGRVSMDRRRFAGLVFQSPEGGAIIFSSGRVVLPGYRSVEDAAAFLRRLSKYLGVESERVVLSVSNIVLACDAGDAQVDLEALARKLPGAVYEPEVFPGLSWRGRAASYLVFSNGKAIVAGLKSFEDAGPAVDELAEVLGVG